MQIKKQLRRISQSSVFIIITVIVLGLLTTFWIWRTTVNSSRNNLENSSSQKIEVIEKFLDERLISYQSILEGNAGFFYANGDTITAEKWHLFVYARQLSENFPAIQSIGYADVAGSVIYSEPSATPSIIGYNLLSDSASAQALNQVAESGKTAFSPIIHLPQKAFLIVHPLFSRINVPASSEKINITGYVYLNINFKKLFEVVGSKAADKNIEYAMTEGENPDNQDFIFKTSGFESNDQKASIQPISLGDKKLTIYSKINKNDQVYKDTRSRPFITIVTGVLMTIVVAVSVGQILNSRVRYAAVAKELELKESRDELLSLASHQLRTPATAVKHYTGMLLQGYGGKIDKKQREFLNRAYNANERQLEIVNQILHVSRIETGSLELEVQVVNITRITKALILEHKKLLKDKKQKMNINIEDKLLEVQGDPTYLAIVIENLLTNASKYTHDGGKISIQIYSDSSCLILEVSDTGVGIDKKDVDQLFKKFSRIHNDLSIRSGGSGIGLYLSKLIVEMHGGTIEIISRKRVGSTFRVKLPLATRKNRNTSNSS